MVLGPVLVLGLLEAGLRLVGYGVPTSFFLERAGAKGEATLTDNPEFGRRFFPPSLVRAPLSLAFPAAKPAGTCRIFVLGESAAMGIPDPSTSFARVLEVMLRDRFPEDSVRGHQHGDGRDQLPRRRRHRAECARAQPDLFVVLLGNNEGRRPVRRRGRDRTLHAEPSPDPGLALGQGHEVGPTREAARRLLPSRPARRPPLLGRDGRVPEESSARRFPPPARDLRPVPENLEAVCAAGLGRGGQGRRLHRAGEPGRLPSLRLGTRPTTRTGPAALGLGSELPRSGAA